MATGLNLGMRRGKATRAVGSRFQAAGQRQFRARVTRGVTSGRMVKVAHG